MTQEFKGNFNVERTMFFSDAVIAIAVTLLALELAVPTGDSDRAIWHSFAEHFGHEYMPFIISFAVIMVFWYQHHRFFEHLALINTQLLIANMVSLFAIILVPFATKVLAGEGETVYAISPVIYASTIVLWGVAQVVMVSVASRYHLWRKGIPSTAPRSMILGTATALGMFAVSIPIAFVSPSAAELTWLLAPVAATITGRIRRRLNRDKVGAARVGAAP